MNKRRRFKAKRRRRATRNWKTYDAKWRGYQIYTERDVRELLAALKG